MVRDIFDFAAEQIAHSLGETVEYEGWPIQAVFGSEFAAVQSGAVRLSSRRPEISVRLADLPGEPAEGHTVVVRGTTYTVATVRPDVEDVSATLVLKHAD